MLILKSMKKYPVKFSLFLALLSAAIVPICALYYAGLYALDFLAMLSIFSTLFTVADVVLPLLFLFSVWGFAICSGRFYGACRQKLGKRNCCKTLGICSSLGLSL